MLAVRSEEKASTTRGEATDRGIRLRGAGVEQGQQPFGSAKVADVDERFDPDRACELGEGLVQLRNIRKERCGQPRTRTCVAARQLERGERARQPMNRPE
jgi:hypothetical protein